MSGGIGMGIFENSALGEHDAVVHRVRRDGVALEFACRGCATPKEFVLEWPEVIALKYGIDPALAFRAHQNVIVRPTHFEFKADDGGWVPVDDRCPTCNFVYAVVVGPDEPERWLASARRSGAINPQTELQLSQFVSGIANAARAQMQAARRPQQLR
jgi:hypothetical protein